MLRSSKLTGRPLCSWPITCRLQPPIDRVDEAVHVTTPLAPLAERQLPDGADRKSMRHVEFGQPLFVVRVGRIQSEHALGELRPGIGAENRVAVGEPLLQLHLERVVLARAVVVERRHVAELRERPQQLRPLNRRAVEAGPGISPRNGFVTLLDEEVVRRIVAIAAGCRQVLRRDPIEVDLARLPSAAGRNVPAAAADICRPRTATGRGARAARRSSSACSGNC